MVELHDGRGTTARFDDAGRLRGFTSQGQTWETDSPGGAWSVTIELEGKAHTAVAAGAPTEVEAGNDAVRFAFEGLRLDDGMELPGRAVARWSLADGLLQGGLEVAGWPASARLVELTMPDVTVPWDDAEATSLTVPIGVGCVLSEAAAHLFERTETATFGTMEYQCFGWAEGSHGLYLDTRDPEGWIKRRRFSKAGERTLRVQFSCLAPLELPVEPGFTLPFPVSLGGYDGHWYDLGRTYRRWASRQVWFSRGPEQRRDSYFADVACWLWNRGASARVAPPAKELARRIGAPVGLDWYWWHKHGYDTEYPDYFPPREGEAVFKQVVADLQAADVRVQVYTNGMTVDQDGGMWEPVGPRSTVVRGDGQYVSHMFNTFTKRRLAFTCGAAEPWHDTVSAFVAQARALGLDGLYIDMIGNAGGYQACYSREHGHAPGAGPYGMQGFRRLFARLRAENPGFPLSTEATQEMYLDLVEGNIICDTSAERWNWHRRWNCPAEVVPLFGSIYHGRAAAFGNYAFLDGIPPFDDLWPQEYRLDPAAEQDWHALCPDQFALEVARTVAFGIQPMVCNLTPEHLAADDLAADVAFLVALARFYHAHREHLLWGDMLPPGELETASVEVAFLQRYIFTAPGEETIARVARPAVLHSAWVSPGGEGLLVLINHTLAPQDVAWQAPSDVQAAEPAEGLVWAGGVLRGTLPARRVVAVPLVAAAGDGLERQAAGLARER